MLLKPPYSARFDRYASSCIRIYPASLLPSGFIRRSNPVCSARWLVHPDLSGVSPAIRIYPEVKPCLLCTLARASGFIRRLCYHPDLSGGPGRPDLSGVSPAIRIYPEGPRRGQYSKKQKPRGDHSSPGLLQAWRLSRLAHYLLHTTGRSWPSCRRNLALRPLCSSGRDSHRHH